MQKTSRNKISMAVIRRLPKYHRYLRELLAKDIQRISSKELSEIIGFTASQIRQDFNNFGGFGQQGYGYNVEDLYSEIGKILGLDAKYKTILIGAGHLGQALAKYAGFDEYGFHLTGIFDISSEVIGTTIQNVEVMHMDKLADFTASEDIDIAYICVNASSAQDITDLLVSSGVKAIWNFAPVDLKVPENVAVENVHLIDHLMTLSYFLDSE